MVLSNLSREKRENFQTMMTSKGFSLAVASCIMSWNWGRLLMRPLSASSM